MRKVLLALAPWMAALAAAQAEGPFPAEVAFTVFGRSASPAWQIGTECYVPVDAVREWGWTARIDARSATLQADGRTLTVPFRNQAGRNVIPLGEVVKELGGGSGWKVGTRTFEVWGVIRKIEVAGQTLTVESTLAGKPRISYLSNPDRLVLDFDGMKLDPKVEVEGSGYRAAQFQPQTVRVVLETDKRPMLAARQIPISNRFSLNLDSIPERPASGEELGTQPPAQNTTNPATDPASLGGSNPTPPPAAPPVEPVPIAMSSTVGAPTLLRNTPNRIVVQFTPSGKLMSSPQVRRTALDEVELTLPGASYRGEFDPKLDTELIRETSVQQGPASTIVRFRLARPLGMELSTSGNNVLLVLIRPNVGDGKLSTKTIVVDPGHGGHDSGARAPDGSATEKNLALAVSRFLAEYLSAEGASVIMTRKTDDFIPLKERAMIANRNSADLFVSVHFNSNQRPNSTSGNMTFYHKKDPIGQLLAECIQNEIAKVSGLRSMGAWSDQRIYDSGFSVLRNSQMPAVLLELGFINHRVDRSKAVTQEFQTNVARAVVKGIKVFLGEIEE